MSLRSKSIHDLRVIAQTFGVDATKLLSMDAPNLIQEIEIRQRGMLPEPTAIPPKPEYDARLMTRPPSKRGSVDEIIQLLTPYIDMGMIVSFPDEETWSMQLGKKTDCGTMRMPLRNIIACAERLAR